MHYRTDPCAALLPKPRGLGKPGTAILRHDGERLRADDIKPGSGVKLEYDPTKPAFVVVPRKGGRPRDDGPSIGQSKRAAYMREYQRNRRMKAKP